MSKSYVTMDGNTAAALASYAFTEVATIYPITPSSTMPEVIDEWVAQGKTNIFGQKVLVKEMQSEGGAAGAMHGVLQGGSLASTYTASQGLLLMIPNMYKMAGELLPGVFHVSARSLSTHALSIFGDHQDVMATRQTGFALLSSSSVQQAYDLGIVAHLAAIEGRVPFLHFFDGFRTSHEVQKIQILSDDVLASLVNKEAIASFKRRALNPDHPVLRGATVNPDIFFQEREAANPFYNALPDIVEKCMAKVSEATGHEYHLFQYDGDPDAENLIIAMGSSCEVIRECLPSLNAEGAKLGLVEVLLYRPFDVKRFLDRIPKTVRRITVLDRTKEPGAQGEPLYADVRNALFDSGRDVKVLGGRYGIASKDFTPKDVLAVYDNMVSEDPKNGFTVGITDDVTFLSLPYRPGEFDPTPRDIVACKFWGMGSDGTVGANKSAVEIVAEHTDKNVQAYFVYDAKKSGGLTVSHVRIGDSPIRASYQVTSADFIACHFAPYLGRYDLLEGIKENGIFLLNCSYSDAELEEKLPGDIKRTIANRHVRFYVIDAARIAREVGLGRRINMIMQAAFFAITKVLPVEEALEHLKRSVVKSYFTQGQEVIDKNHRGIELGAVSARQVNVPAHWATAPDAPAKDLSHLPYFARVIAQPMLRQKGDNLPVSVFKGYEDGTFPLSLTKWEKPENSTVAPEWNPEACIQCNRCSVVCPHAVIRPMLVSKEQVESAPEGYQAVQANDEKEYFFHMAISVQDCTGCSSCVNACPRTGSALKMAPIAPKREERVAAWAYDEQIVPYVPENKPITLKTSQFRRPLVEFSCACAGCGETPYAKLVTQLFGDRMMISESAGCSTVWSGAAPSVSYTTNHRGHGPAWGFSLFEDNAEYGFGMMLGANAERRRVRAMGEELLKTLADGELKDALQAWLDGFDESENTRARADRLIRALEAEKNRSALAEEFYQSRDFFIKRSHWVMGGDGWAYDIGYGGLDHVLASGENINVLVFDTELYSNTGGQSSKSTPLGAVAKFDAAGKKTGKKDLGRMAMSYGYVYVAQIALGADPVQALRAIREAESYDGPSLIIAYCQCLNHGIKGGLSNGLAHVKHAVDCGYWTLYRYDPRNAAKGKNPFMMDSKQTRADVKDFLMDEVRFSALYRRYPKEQADLLIEQANADIQRKLDEYVRLSKMEY